MLEAQHLLYNSYKISFILWCYKTFHVVHEFSIHFLKYLLKLSFRSCKYLLVSYIQVFNFFWQTWSFDLMLKISLLVYKQAPASTASTLPRWIMSLSKMTFELLFTSKQNSRTFVAHCDVFIHNLSIQEQTRLLFGRCCSKTWIKRFNWFL